MADSSRLTASGCILGFPLEALPAPDRRRLIESGHRVSSMLLILNHIGRTPSRFLDFNPGASRLEFCDRSVLLPYLNLPNVELHNQMEYDEGVVKKWGPPRIFMRLLTVVVRHDLRFYTASGPLAGTATNEMEPYAPA